MIADSLHVEINCEVDVVSWITCYGTEYRPGLYGVLPPDVGPVFSPSRWLFLDSLVALGTGGSVLWRHVLQHVPTHTVSIIHFMLSYGNATVERL
ncbi:hypothetical protein N1851_005829 [Merluccius polli]|uniref:Uncharacterized protein n=1 Tax=Merluccius polli TaxID=89951 RepID=A0AA47PAU9_MERPO|nr:hypothetical protein N1851_005829 [Merluccius polli]